MRKKGSYKLIFYMFSLLALILVLSSTILAANSTQVLSLGDCTSNTEACSFHLSTSFPPGANLWYRLWAKVYYAGGSSWENARIVEFPPRNPSNIQLFNGEYWLNASSLRTDSSYDLTMAVDSALPMTKVDLWAMAWKGTSASWGGNSTTFTSADKLISVSSEKGYCLSGQKCNFTILLPAIFSAAGDWYQIWVNGKIGDATYFSAINSSWFAVKDTERVEVNGEMFVKENIEIDMRQDNRMPYNKLAFWIRGWKVSSALDTQSSTSSWTREFNFPVLVSEEENKRAIIISTIGNDRTKWVSDGYHYVLDSNFNEYNLSKLNLTKEATPISESLFQLTRGNWKYSKFIPVNLDSDYYNEFIFMQTNETISSPYILILDNDFSLYNHSLPVGVSGGILERNLGDNWIKVVNDGTSFLPIGNNRAFDMVGADVDGDEKDEIIIVTSESSYTEPARLIILDDDLKTRLKVSDYGNNYVYSLISDTYPFYIKKVSLGKSGDINGDGKDEIIVTHYYSGPIQNSTYNQKANIYQYDSASKNIYFLSSFSPWQDPEQNDNGVSTLYANAADLNGDGISEIVTGFRGKVNNGYFYLAGYSSSSRTFFGINTGNTAQFINMEYYSNSPWFRMTWSAFGFSNPIFIGDLDADGKDEVILTLQNTTTFSEWNYLLDNNLQPLTLGNDAKYTYFERAFNPNTIYPTDLAWAHLNGSVGLNKLRDYGTRFTIAYLKNKSLPTAVLPPVIHCPNGIFEPALDEECDPNPPNLAICDQSCKNIAQVIPEEGMRCVSSITTAEWENKSTGARINVLSTGGNCSLFYNQTGSFCCPTNQLCNFGSGKCYVQVSNNCNQFNNTDKMTCESQSRNSLIPWSSVLNPISICNITSSRFNFNSSLIDCYNQTDCICSWNDATAECRGSPLVERTCRENGTMIPHKDKITPQCFWTSVEENYCDSYENNILYKLTADWTNRTNGVLAPSGCIDGEEYLPCPSGTGIRLGFFDSKSLIFSVFGILIIYCIIVLRKKK